MERGEKAVTVWPIRGKEQAQKIFDSISTIGTNNRTKKDSTISIGINKIGTLSRICISNRVCTTGGDYKDLDNITYFNYNKNGHYISTCTKPRKDYNSLKN